jgi:peptidoglycan/LPS O-acetylase OafA/YrhL
MVPRRCQLRWPFSGERPRTIPLKMIAFPGFDGLRLAAALLVLVSHAMFTRAGVPPDDAVSQWLADAGVGGVYVFFMVSGFLLARSLDHQPDALRFAVNRVLRIYPGFVACVLVTALLFGAVGTALSPRAYFSDAELWRHLRLTLDCLCSNAWLPGVWDYAGDEAMRRVVNGSLWSLSAEVLSYLLLLALWLLLRRSVWATVLVLVGLTLATRASGVAFERLASVAFTLPYFAGGAVAWLVVRRWGVRTGVALGCMAGVVLAAAGGHTAVAGATLGAYAVVWLGTHDNPLSRLSKHTGDLSYGVYLYGWPVQQLVRVFSPVDTPWVTLALCLPITLVCAWLSHRFIEAPALRLKGPAWSGLQQACLGEQPRAARAGRIAGLGFAVAALSLLVWPQPLWWWVSACLAALALGTALLAWAARRAAACCAT